MTKLRLTALFFLTAVVGLTFFAIVRHRENASIEWTTYSKATLEKSLDDKKTALLFLSADWDINAKMLERFVLNSAEVKRAVRSNGIVALKADSTSSDRSGEFKAWTNNFSSTVIVFRDGKIDVADILPHRHEEAIIRLIHLLERSPATPTAG